MPILKKLQSIYDRVDVATGQNLEVDKPYLLLLVPADSPDQDYASGEWIALRGRKEVFDYIMNYVANGNYLLLKSFILSGGITFGNEVSIYTFARLCIEKFQYGTQEDLEHLDLMATDTAIIGNDPITDEELGRFYSKELSQRSK
jgi:hypothetical protein